MNRSKSSTSCVSLHVTVQNSQNKVLFNKMFKVDVHNDKCMLETVQAAFTVIKPDIHAPTELLEVGEKMLRVSVAAANKRQTVESVLMPLNDCALVSAHGADVSEYGWNGMRHEGVLEVRCENVHLRTQVGERGYRDAEKLFDGKEACLVLLRMLGERPSVRTPAVAGVRQSFLHGNTCTQAEIQKRMEHFSPLRCATWNIAGGHRSSLAPESFSLDDQRSAVVREIRRWQTSFGCDVLALQECESADAVEV